MHTGAGGGIRGLVGGEGVQRRLLRLAGDERRGQRGGVGGGFRGLVGAADPGVRKELLDGVSLLGVDSQQVGDEVLGGFGDVVPPGGEERVLAPGDLLGQDLDALVVKGREAAEEGVEDAAHGPHVDTLRVALILDDLGGGVTDGTAGGHGLAIPDDLGEAEVGNLDDPDTASAFPGNEFPFVHLVFIAGLAGFGMFGRDEGRGVEEEVFGFDISARGLIRGRLG